MINKIFAFIPFKEECNDCIEMVRKWNLALIEGTGFECRSCGNKMTLKMFKAEKVEDKVAYGVSTEQDFTSIVPVGCQINSDVYTPEKFSEFCTKNNLGDKWQEDNRKENLIVYKNNVEIDPKGTQYLSPLTGAVLIVNIV